jgi:hypothetical protein
LSPDYAKELDTYKIDRPSRHAMDDCNKAINMAREKHGLGIEKGEFLSRMYLEGQTRYEDALNIAVKVAHLCDKKILEIEDEDYPLREKMSKATKADKEVNIFTGTSQYETWKEELEVNENQIAFYKTIIKNAKIVKTESTDGIKSVDALKAEVMKVRDVEPFQLKLDGLVEDAEKVYREAELCGSNGSIPERITIVVLHLQLNMQHLSARMETPSSASSARSLARKATMATLLRTLSNV